MGAWRNGAHTTHDSPLWATGVTVGSWQLGQIPCLQLTVKPAPPPQQAGKWNFLRLRPAKKQLCFIAIISSPEARRRVFLVETPPHHPQRPLCRVVRWESAAVFVQRSQPHTHRPLGELSVLRAAGRVCVFAGDFAHRQFQLGAVLRLQLAVSSAGRVADGSWPCR